MKKSTLLAGALLLSLTRMSTAKPSVAMKTAKEIRIEANRSSTGKGGHPLPLLASWNTGSLPGVTGFDAAYQIELVEKGHHVMPAFTYPNISVDVPPRFSYDPSPIWSSYYEGPMKRAAALKLPITLISTQWDRLLTDDPAYLNLPADKNPNVVTPDGKVLNKVSPFWPVEPWREVEAKWASSPLLQKLQEWYLAPPRLEFLSNNEHRKLNWTDAEQDARYLKLYGTGRDDNFKRRVIAEGWAVRYKALQDGMGAALVNLTWRKNVIFVAYNGFGAPYMGSWAGWEKYSLHRKYSLHSTNIIDPYPLFWDGGSPSYYVENWEDTTDYKLRSPQVITMNWVFMQREALKLNPHFWFEMSAWDGYMTPDRVNEKTVDKRSFYRSLGQIYEPPRYAGFTQFGLWLLRPRVVRDFRYHDDKRADMKPYFLAMAQTVDRIYGNENLRSFWRSGELVPNRSGQHPFQAGIPVEYQKEDRWFLLDTNLDAPKPWTMKTEIPVFSLALVKGKVGRGNGWFTRTRR